MSILPHVSKMYEGFMYDQLYPYFNEIFSKLHCRFCKGYNMQQCFYDWIWQKTFDFADDARAPSISRAFFHKVLMPMCAHVF